MPRRRPTGSARAALKKLELARALATRPRLLLADESLGGLRLDRDGARPPICSERSASRMGVNDHLGRALMGVLMRIVDRVIVLDPR